MLSRRSALGPHANSHSRPSGRSGRDRPARSAPCALADLIEACDASIPIEICAALAELVHQLHRLDMFAIRDRIVPGVPVFSHCYDFPIPNGPHPICAGPWLKPSLDFCNWSVADGTNIVRGALVAFRTMLKSLEADPKNNFHFVDTQGTLSRSDWANELHPNPDGFNAIAQKFAAALDANLRSTFDANFTVSLEVSKEEAQAIGANLSRATPKPKIKAEKSESKSGRKSARNLRKAGP